MTDHDKKVEVRTGKDTVTIITSSPNQLTRRVLRKSEIILTSWDSKTNTVMVFMTNDIKLSYTNIGEKEIKQLLEIIT